MIEIEMTDTFGGEANYCWVKRDTIDNLTSDTNRALLKAIREKFELEGVKLDLKIDSGDFKRWDIRGACACVMAQWRYY